MSNRKVTVKKITSKKNSITLSTERAEIFLKLKQKKWYKKTSPAIKKELKELPEDYDGFLRDLANRRETIGHVDVLRLKKLLVGKWQAVPVFEVRSNLTNQVFTYEYSSWKYGKHTGSKGVLFVEIEGEIKFFIIRKADRFPIAAENIEALGGFDPGYHKSRFPNFSKKIERQIKKALNVRDLKFEKYYNLGSLSPDAGQSNQSVYLFAGVINVDDARKINKEIPNKYYDYVSEIQIVPIERLSEYVSKSEDGFFLACISRLAAQKIIKL
jgi:hypothetical protein